MEKKLPLKILNQSKKNCCGCSACSSVCSKGCIKMQPDMEGFEYPQIDIDKCVGCHLCEEVCPFLNEKGELTPMIDYAALNIDEEIRGNSSSGGVFYSIAEKVLLQKGIVFGAQFDEHWSVMHTYIEDMDELPKYMGSKYVQSHMGGGNYKKVRDFLHEGRYVLFSGTPCQIAGLKSYLKKDYEKLLTIDFICHGVPSPKVWYKYVSELSSIKHIGNISFRDKSEGWSHFSLKIDDKKSNEIYKSIFQNDPYMQLFLNNYILRPSCYDCKVRKGKSGSDITLADFWNIQNVMPEKYDDKGISLVLCNTEKGRKILCANGIELHVVNHNEIIKYNKAWYESYQPPYNRDEIISELLCSKVKNVFIKHFHPELLLKNRVKNLISRVRNKVKRYF